MRFKHSVLATALVVSTAFLWSTAALHAGTHAFNMDSIDGNTTLDGTQFGVEVIDIGGGQVEFKLSNAGPTASRIHQIYWDDDASVLDSLFSADPGFGTDPASPGNLPGGNNIAFSADFGVDVNPPKPQTKAIGPGDMASFVFDLDGIATAADVDAAIVAGTLRLGIHVQGIDPRVVVSSDSDAFVTGGNPIPEPTTLLLFGSGLLVGAGVLKRKFF